MQDLAQLITFVEACIPDSDISVLEKALIIHYEYMDATLSRASLSQTTYDTALQDLRSRLPRDGRPSSRSSTSSIMLLLKRTVFYTINHPPYL